MTWFLGVCSIGINIYFLSTSLVGWITTTKMPRSASIILGLLLFPTMTLYLAMLAYLTLKPETPLQVVSTDSGTDNSENNEPGTRGRTAEVSSNQSGDEIEMDDIICT